MCKLVNIAEVGINWQLVPYFNNTMAEESVRIFQVIVFANAQCLHDVSSGLTNALIHKLCGAHNPAAILSWAEFRNRGEMEQLHIFGAMVPTPKSSKYHLPTQWLMAVWRWYVQPHSKWDCKVINIRLLYRGINPERSARGKGRRTLK